MSNAADTLEHKKLLSNREKNAFSCMINVRVTQSQCSTPSYIRMHSGPSATPMNCDWCCLKTKNKAFCAPSIIPITTHNLIDITITAVTDMRYAWNSRSDNRQQKLAIWTMFERVQMDIILMFRQRIHRRPTNTNNKWKKKYFDGNLWNNQSSACRVLNE